MKNLILFDSWNWIEVKVEVRVRNANILLFNLMELSSWSQNTQFLLSYENGFGLIARESNLLNQSYILIFNYGINGSCEFSQKINI